MGLDMHLYKKIYVGEHYEHNGIKSEVKVHKTDKDGNVKTVSLDEPICSISIEVGYWRKANAIHGWFVKNIQEGNDDCGTYDVDVSQLKDLRDLCSKILTEYEIHEKLMGDKPRALAEKLLPPTSGCFFGSYEYDEDYIQDLKDTVEIIDKAVEGYEKNEADGFTWVDFQYSSSW